MSDDSQPALKRRARTKPIPASEIVRLGAQYLSAGRFREADTLFMRALASRPRDARAWHRRGLVASMNGRMEEAVALLRNAVACQHNFTPACVELARVLQISGHLDEALAVAHSAVDSASRAALAYLALGNILCERGEALEGVAAHKRAVELDPFQAETHFRLGLAYQQVERHEEAAIVLERAIELEPGRADVHYSLGTVRHALRHLDLALASYDRALALRPSLAENLYALGKPRHIHALIENRDLNGALQHLDAFLHCRPGQSCALALKAIVLNELGERDEARKLVDFGNLIRTVRLGPDGGSNGELNDALARHILQHPTLRDAPDAFSMHRGKTTGDLLQSPSSPLRHLATLIEVAVERYAATLPDGASHPFVANRPERWTMTMWANVIQLEEFQVPHIQPSGWLSGVYYVRVPETVRSDGPAGWIQFGKPYHDVAGTVHPELLTLQPEEGLLLLFPSYFYRRTLPFHGADQRISIAFDIIPKH